MFLKYVSVLVFHSKRAVWQVTTMCMPGIARKRPAVTNQSSGAPISRETRDFRVAIPPVSARGVRRPSGRNPWGDPTMSDRTQLSRRDTLKFLGGVPMLLPVASVAADLLTSTSALAQAA